MEFDFEFGFKKSNLMRRSFHGDALIEASMVSPHVAISKEVNPQRKIFTN